MMKIHRLLPLLVALPGLSGCPSSPCFDSGVGSSPMPPGMILVGEETRLLVSPQFQFGCEEEAPASPTSVTVEVYDPDNQPVEHTSSLVSTSLTATILFTARKPGRHHVFVAFDPVGGIHQSDLYAATDRSNEAATLTLVQTCNALERTSKGAFVCDQYVLRDGSAVKTFSSTSKLAVAGDVVWMVDSQKVERYVDTGTTLALTSTLSHSQGGVGLVRASENELVALFSGTLQRFTFNGTALAATTASSWVSPPHPIHLQGPRVLMVRTGDRLGLVTRLVGSNPGGAAPRHEVCPYRLDNGRFVRAPESCSSFDGIVVGYEPNALWVGDPQSFSEQSFTGLRYLEWTATGLVTQASLPLGFNLKVGTRPFADRLSAVPTISSTVSSINSLPRSAVAIYSPERRAILLEHLDPNLVEPVATQHLLWGNQFVGSSSGATRIRIRPSTP
jgi:hypothetical protein